MIQRIRHLVQTNGSIARPDVTNAPITPVATTTASHSEELLSFAERYEWFTRYALSRIPNFTVEATNKPIIAALLAYFIQDSTECQRRGVNPQKGLFLVGPVGCGKTTLMRLLAEGFRSSCPPKNLPSESIRSVPRFRITTAREVVRQFLQEGHPVLNRYGAGAFRAKHFGYGPVLQYDQPLTYCFDDIGMESDAKRYGNDCNVMAEVLLDRYDQFVRRGMITHLTTNLNAQALENLYGDRVRSRLREMCNLVCFPEEAKDRRK